MHPDAKRRLELVEQTIHGILSPLGFKKQKSNWRRDTGELLQQFSVVSKQLYSLYYPDWGLNLLRYCEDPKPSPWKLAVQWSLVRSVKDTHLRLRFSNAFNFDEADEFHPDFLAKSDEERDPITPDDERSELVTKLLRKYVVPCFEKFGTERSVHEMFLAPQKFPPRLRAYSFGGVPESWNNEKYGGPGWRKRMGIAE